MKKKWGVFFRATVPLRYEPIYLQLYEIVGLCHSYPIKRFSTGRV